MSNNHHEGHEENEEKNLQTLHVLHGKNIQNCSGCENVITASCFLLCKREMGDRQISAISLTFPLIFIIFIENPIRRIAHETT